LAPRLVVPDTLKVVTEVIAPLIAALPVIVNVLLFPLSAEDNVIRVTDGVVVNVLFALIVIPPAAV
jgi:hypothetical protein